MASNTKKSENQRLKKSRKVGKRRKKLLARDGTTRNELQLFGSELAAPDAAR